LPIFKAEDSQARNALYFPVQVSCDETCVCVSVCVCGVCVSLCVFVL